MVGVRCIAFCMPSVPWESRPHLLFFSGHVPKVNINPTRYLIWRQVRNLRGVITASHTLNCSVGSYLNLCFGGGLTRGGDLTHFCNGFCQRSKHCVQKCRPCEQGTTDCACGRVPHAQSRSDESAQHSRARSSSRRHAGARRCATVADGVVGWATLRDANGKVFMTVS